MSALFPEIYHRRIDQALMRAASNLDLAERRGRPGRGGDRAHQHGRARLSRGQPRRTSAAAPTASGSRLHRTRQADSRDRTGSCAHVRLRQAFPAIVAVNRNRTERPALAISPPSDIVLDVARAAEPATLEAARARLASRDGCRGGRPSAEAFSVGDLGIAARPAARRPTSRRPNPTRSSRPWCCRPSSSRCCRRRPKPSTARAWPATCGNR